MNLPGIIAPAVAAAYQQRWLSDNVPRSQVFKESWRTIWKIRRHLCSGGRTAIWIPAAPRGTQRKNPVPLIWIGGATWLSFQQGTSAETPRTIVRLRNDTTKYSCIVVHACTNCHGRYWNGLPNITLFLSNTPSPERIASMSLLWRNLWFITERVLQKYLSSLTICVSKTTHKSCKPLHEGSAFAPLSTWWFKVATRARIPRHVVFQS